MSLITRWMAVAAAVAVVPAAYASGNSNAAVQTITPSTLACTNGNTDQNAGFVECKGAYEMSNVDNHMPEVLQLLGLNSSTPFFSSESFAAKGNPFANTAGAGASSGTITFDGAQKGSFWIALKAATAASFYHFNGALVSGGISSINFDTLGVSLTNNGSKDLSHALYIGDPTAAGDVPTPAPIPEPGTYALLLAGLGAIGFISRRRRA